MLLIRWLFGGDPLISFLASLLFFQEKPTFCTTAIGASLITLAWPIAPNVVVAAAVAVVAAAAAVVVVGAAEEKEEEEKKKRGGTLPPSAELVVRRS